MADANFESFFGAGGGGVGLIPLFPPKRTLNNYTSGAPDGFTGNGDNIVLPTTISGGGNILYVNNAGTTVWTKASTDINAACDAWCTFNMDAVDAVLWVVAIATSTNKFYLATINSAGTIVVKGNATATATLTAAGYGWVGGSSAATRGGNMWRTTPGAGNFTLRLSAIDVVLNYTNGAIVSESAAKVDYLPGMFASTSGALFMPAGTPAANGASAITGALQELYIRKPTSFDVRRYAAGVLRVPAASSIGLPTDISTTTGGPSFFTSLQWKGDVLLVRPGGSSGGNPVLYDYLEYLAAVDTLMLNYRWDV